MKHLFVKLAVRLRQRVSFGRGAGRWLNEDVVASMDKWFKDKGYCQSDQSMGDVAEKFGISKDELSWYCHSTYGCGFLSIRKELRIYEAKRIIEENPFLPLNTIGEMVGISDKTNFRRQFFEVTGETPQEYRDRIKAGRGRRRRIMQ